MGYNSQKLNDFANKPMGACFMTVGSKGFSLTSLVPQGIGTSQGAIIALQLLSSGGATTNEYKYFNGSKMPAYRDYNGWYKDSTPIKPENDVYFSPGEGFWINAQQEGISLQNSGEVLFSSVTRGLNGFANIMLANPYPMELKLSNITVGGAGTSQGAIVALQLLSSGGATTNEYKYYNGSKMPAYRDYNGWYKDTTPIKVENDVSFPAGQGFWVNAQQNNLTLTFSSGIDVAE